MKTSRLLSAAPFLPLVLVMALAFAGITFDPWVYVILAVVCPAVAVLIWRMVRTTERKAAGQAQSLKERRGRKTE